MIYPKFLDKNNYIGIPAPSGGAGNIQYKNKYENAENFFKKTDYNLVVSKNLYNSNRGRSADAVTRGEEFNEMLKDKNINMILCASGGDFLVEILPYVDFDLIKKKPKLVCGFSDPTGLLFPITTKYDIATIYGNNFSSFGMEKLHNSQKNFLEIIKGNIIEQKSYDMYEENSIEKVTGLEYYNLDTKVEWKIIGENKVDINGRIIGGCFDLIAELAGTKYDGISSFNDKYKEDGIIWYFDNAELTKEETIRTLWKLNEFDYFKYTKAVIFGRFGNESTYYDYTVESCLKDSILNRLDIPIIYDADISHKSPTLTIINGAMSYINVENGKAKIKFELT